MKKLDRPILADGELTGHIHILDDEKIEVFETDEGTREFKLLHPAKLLHQEHSVIEINELEKSIRRRNLEEETKINMKKIKNNCSKRKSKNEKI